jgi:hypothetical protein
MIYSAMDKQYFLYYILGHFFSQIAVQQLTVQI